MCLSLDKSLSEEEEKKTEQYQEVFGSQPNHLKTEQYQGGVRAVARTPKKTEQYQGGVRAVARTPKKGDRQCRAR